MTKFEDIKANLLNGAKVIVGLNTYKGAADVVAFAAKYENEADLLRYAQTRIFLPGVRYSTHFRAAH